ncbi:glycosyltransferase family 4 protein [Pleurocapsa sp. FMAR1]|uniref:glycosyltransferase family 4 protein n=1 Tax=Pleurocapsa sp. FMAR1 TaxID=3040204 RepID=UPI0029C83F2B|nr:glycosyltransferase family 4 protein [Pleurocapsa sp. FMAR1]
MKLAYVSTFDSRTLKGKNEWSGTGYHIAQCLKKQLISLEYIGPLEDSVTLRAIGKLKRHYYEFVRHKNYQKNADPLTLKHYASQVAQKLNSTQADLVFSATVNPIAYLECDCPIAFWADGTFANIQNFYPQYSNLPEEVIRDWHQMERLALQKSKLAIYSSDWAARSAVNDYGADPERVKVVPFGSNTDSPFSSETIKDVIASRTSDRCKLLFLTIDWERKGGDVAFQVAKKLNQSGLQTELTVVGCQPSIKEPLPDFVKALGFISKSTKEGKQKIQELIMDSHFLILPTLADCSPIVLCEANALGVPCLSTTVGGIPTIVRNGLNGQLFDENTKITEYCDYITHLFDNYSDYQRLALSSFNEYQSRLNWKVAGKMVKNFLENI